MSLTFPLTACGTERHVIDPAPGENVTQTILSWHLREAWPTVWLVIVDDRLDPVAQHLRDSIVQKSENLYDQYDSADCGIHPDPAYYRAVDYSLIIVGASRPEDALHPGRFAELRISSENASQTAQDAWNDAFSQAINAVVRDEERPQRYIDALYYWSEILAGVREPSYASEVALLEHLPPAFTFVPVLAMSAKDSSTSPIEPWSQFWSQNLNSADSRLRDHSSWWDLRVQVFDGVAGHCPSVPVDEVGEPLYTLLEPHGFVSIGFCDYSRGLLSPNFVADCAGYTCMSTPDTINEGQAACQIRVTVDADLTCSRPGWLDPLGENGAREPRYQKTEHGLKRVCEVVQLTGAALAACKSDPYCEGCEPGWCLRDYWDEVEGNDSYDWKNSYCAPDQTSQGLIRFTLGTDQGEGLIRIACESGTSLEAQL